MPVQLRPHQVEAIEKMRNGCILYGDVGVGKTITSLGYYFTKVCGGTIGRIGSLEAPRDVYVITTAKVRNSGAFQTQAAAYGIFEDRSISTNGVKITVDSWNNIAKYVEVENAFFIFDEQRVVGYGKWSRSFIKIARANEWILLSATPGDTWMDYIPVFIANGWYKHKTDFVDQHVIWTPRVKYPKVLRYQNVGTLVRRRNSVLVHMPYERHTVRHPVDVWCDFDQDKFDKVVKKKWHVFENRPLRDVSELFSVMRKVVNSDETRLSAVSQLLEKHPKLIVFYNFDYELEMLRELGASLMMPDSDTSSSNLGLRTPEGVRPERLSASHSKSSRDSSTERSTSSSMSGSEHGSEKTGSFSVAEYNGHKHEEVPTTDSWLYLVQYRAGAEGWNCIETDAICFYSQTYSYRDWIQAHGRIDRLNTPFVDLWYYHLVSRSIIDKAVRKALKQKKSFNERDLAL